MSHNSIQDLELANSLANEILFNTSVESFGVMNQNLFIDFRNSLGEDSRLIINGLISLSNFEMQQGVDNISHALLCMNRINLLTINSVKCMQNQELILNFSADLVFKVDPDIEVVDEDIWQLNNHLHVSEGGRTIIALVGGGYAIW